MAKKILLIDDEPDFTELIRTLLGFHGLQVDVFNDPAPVAANIQTTKYDLIVSDLMMPGLDGFQLVDKIRSQTAYKKTPVIVLSAKTLTDDERKTLMNHQVHFLTKPFEPQGLVEQIQQLLGQS